MKPSQPLLPWIGVVFAGVACLMAVFALGRTYVLSTNLNATHSTPQTSSTPYTSSPYPAMDNSIPKTNGPTSSTMIVPKNLRDLGFEPVDCTEEDVEIYLQTDVSVLLLEGCGAMGGTLWEYTPAQNTLKKRMIRYQFGTTGPSPDKRYQIVLGEADADGEVRRLLIKDFIEDTESATTPLPKELSYTQTISEYYGSALGRIEWTDASYTTASVEIYDARIPLTQPGDTRLPVLQRFISVQK